MWADSLALAGPPMREVPVKGALSIKEAAVVLDVHEMTVRRLIKAGKLAAFRVGRIIRIRRGSLAEYSRANLYSR
jgi:excisionase family DNA binding protein